MPKRVVAKTRTAKKGNGSLPFTPKQKKVGLIVLGLILALMSMPLALVGILILLGVGVHHVSTRSKK